MSSPTRPRVLILDPGNFTPLYDVNLGLELVERGWDVEWVTSKHQFDEMPAAGSVRVREAFFGRLGRPPFDRLAALRQMRHLRRATKMLSYPLELAAFHRTLSEMKPGIIHVQWALLPHLDAALWRRWRQRGWLVVYTAHDPEPLTGSLFQVLPRWTANLCAAADRVIVHGRAARQELEKRGVGPERVEVLPPGAPTMRPLLDRQAARMTLSLNPRSPVALFFGYIKKYKGLHILLESLPRVRASLGEVTLLVAGELMESRWHYRRLIRQLGLEREVRWIAGYVPERLAPVYFAAADLVAVPYLEASSSAVLLSAYAYQRPVVATAVGGTPELVEDGVTGLLVPPGDPTALALAISRVLADPQMAASMGARGRQMAERRFAWREIARLTEDLYLRLWGGGR